MKSSLLIASEKKVLPAFIVCFVFVFITGLAHCLVVDLNLYSQLNLVVHLLFGFFVLLVSPIYCYRHFKRVVGIRKPLVNALGAVSSILLIVYLSLSIYIFILGHREDNVLIFNLHAWGALIILISIASHVLVFRFVRYGKKTKTNFTSIKGFSSEYGKKTLVSSVTYLLLVLIVSRVGGDGMEEGYDTGAKDYDYSYGDHPFLPSQTDTKDSQFIHQEFIANSHTCESCHQEIFDQWVGSTHRLAAADPTYVTNISLLAEKKGIAATRYCEGCHAPVALLTGELTPGGQHGGISGTPANHEGVGCVSCHRATKAVHLEGVASYYFEPQRSYLFDNSNNFILSAINKLMISLYAEPHKQDMSSSFIAEPASCATCHSQFMDKELNNWGWVKMQDEYRAWLDSPFSNQGDPTFGGGEVQRCQDCHMPLVKSKDPSANRDGFVRSHRFAAANTMLPFLAGDQVQLRETINFLQSNKMHISIEEPNRRNATQSVLTVNEPLRLHSETPYYLYLNEEASLNVSVANTGVGHNFPGGTTDINQAWVEFKVVDVTGATIFHSGFIGDGEILDPAAHIYQSIPVDRFGNHVWKHDLFNMVGRTYKNVVEAGKSDLINYKFSIPSWVKGPISIMATLKYRKLNTRYAKWSLKELYTPLPIVDMARDTLVVDVLKEPSAK